MSTPNVTDIFASLNKPQPGTTAEQRVENLLQLYRELEEQVDIRHLPENEYEQIFVALVTAAGFNDPMDAVDALAHAPGRSFRFSGSAAQGPFTLRKM
ncbi:MAG TPA: hypothetical protein VFA76_05675 [Terriglobales bacterium]|nr:hypothetical protein [Terriglobales bacterium]